MKLFTALLTAVVSVASALPAVAGYQNHKMDYHYRDSACAASIEDFESSDIPEVWALSSYCGVEPEATGAETAKRVYVDTHGQMGNVKVYVKAGKIYVGDKVTSVKAYISNKAATLD